MKLAIVGSRTFENYGILKRVVLENIDMNKVSCIVSGGANGADSLAQRLAKEYGKIIIIHYPDWNRLGKSAGYTRNLNIIKDSDTILAMWNGRSSGTAHTIKQGKNYRRNVIVSDFSGVVIENFKPYDPALL